MNNKTFQLILLLLMLSARQVMAAGALAFSFEDGLVSDQWVASQGSFTVNTEHSTDGSRSLCWDIPAASTAGATFNVQLPAFNSLQSAVFFSLYNPQKSAGTLIVDFIDDMGKAKYTAKLALDFVGWRDCYRYYTQDFVSKSTGTIVQVKFTLNAPEGRDVKLYFDNINFKATTSMERQASDFQKFDCALIGYKRTGALSCHIVPIDLPTTTPTQGELDGLSKVRQSYPARRPKTPNTSQIDAARTYINSLNIVRNADGSVHGTTFPSSNADLTPAFLVYMLNNLEAIAYTSTVSSSDKTLFQNYLDHIIDQGILYKFPVLKTNDYSTVRTVLSALVDILPLCSDFQKQEMLNSLEWLSLYRMLYLSDQDLYDNQLVTSDYIYLMSPYLFYYACNQNDAVAVRELKALSRFYVNETNYHDGGWDILKIDGTSFHHLSHYNAYMYAYNPWIAAIKSLSGTPFRITPEAYARLKKGMLSLFIMSNKGGQANLLANSLAGRHPMTGLKNAVTQTSFENMVDIGGDIMGTGIDTELAAAYNYFFSTTKYPVQAGSFDGFYQFNYGPIGIYRHNNWVATMHAPTTKFWGAEIYSKQNRLGRYLSHGALEIMYDGDASASGLPQTDAGWDWNTIPGTTTVHYASWADLMPGRNTSSRFDQYTKTKDFAGALAWDDCGIFASDFDQIDSWGSQLFQPTNLEFKKSVFAFDGMLLSLGSGIRATGSYSLNNQLITATNLFQSINPTIQDNLSVDGQPMPAGSAAMSKPSGSACWMLTPEGTGYYVLNGNDAVVIANGVQEGPKADGSDVQSPTTAVAAKAYINHGVNPSAAKYSFLVVPATSQADMTTLASKINGSGGSLFTIKSQSDQFHAVTWNGGNTTGYTFFTAVSGIGFGQVESAASEMLLLQKTVNDHEMSLAVDNPNLYPVAVPGTYNWQSTPTYTSVVLRGSWQLKQAADGVDVTALDNDRTQVDFILSYGEPLYIDLVKTTTGIAKISSSKDISVSARQDSREVEVQFATPTTSPAKVEVYDVSGRLLSRYRLTLGVKSQRLKVGNIARSTVVQVKVSTGNLQKCVKLMM